MSKKNMTVVDLFSGCGGFSEGFYLAGFEIICAIDHWGTARNSIAFNHGQEVIPRAGKKYNYDIERISKLPNHEFNKIIPDSEIIIGSPPCVSFSNSNRSGSSNKDLGIRLIESFMLIVARKKNKPNSVLKHWIMENVPKSEKFIKDEYVFFKGANGYERQRKNIIEITNVKGQHSGVYDLSEYGVPSKRLRYICGDFMKPEKHHRNTKTPTELILGNILKAIKLNGKVKNIRDPIWTNLILKTRDITDHYYLNELAEWEWKKAKRQKRDKGYMGQMSFPENMNNISRTIMAFSSTSAREAFILPHKKDQYRNPTVREYATLMSFPMNYQFAGMSHSIKKKQIGNAVPPKFSFALARAIFDTKGPSQELLKTRVEMNGEFINLNNKVFEKRIEKKKRFNIIFDQHIPYLKINAYRTVLDNRESDWHNRKIKWKASIHKGAGHYKTLQPSLKLCDDYFKLTKKQLNIIEKLKLRKGTELNLHNNYRTTLDKRRKDKLLGPNELLASIKDKLLSPKYKKIKNFSKLEKHDAKDYIYYSFVEPKTKIEYLVPEPVLLGYYILKLIVKNKKS